MSLADNNTTVAIELNQDAVAALNAAIGSTISFGGRITTLAGTSPQVAFASTSGAAGQVQLVLRTELPDWYSITMPDTAHALRVETSTPGGGSGEPVNTFNPRIELYDSTGTTLIASGLPMPDGRNETMLAAGLTPGETYKVRVSSDGHTSGEYFLTRVFNSSPQVADLAVTPTVNENASATLNGTFSDVNAVDSHTVVITWGDGQSSTLSLAAGVLSFSAAHQYLDDAPTGTVSDVYSINVTVTDDLSESDSGSVALTVNNVAPVVDPLSGPSSGVRGQALDFAGLFQDAGTADTHTARWDFGDGTIIDFVSTDRSSPATAAHTYTSEGTYTVALTIRDDDGGVTSVQKTVTITAVALQTDPCDPEKTALVIGGTTANDTIVISPQGSGGGVAVLINGVSKGVFQPTGHVIVYGQAGDDDIQVAGSIGLETWLFGEAGNDRLKGGSGAAILSGGDGDDLLNGGGGRSVLIGGRGKDRLIGASGDDILIGGFTLYDGSVLSLCTILHEWNSGNGYADRVADLKRLLNAITVINDQQADMLTGSSGLDWFFADVGDTVTRIQDEEIIE
jgi:Ca2+-binding RTX toxin-like protein